jgi:hypothetical protein
MRMRALPGPACWPPPFEREGYPLPSTPIPNRVLATLLAVKGTAAALRGGNLFLGPAPYFPALAAATPAAAWRSSAGPS